VRRFMVGMAKRVIPQSAIDAYRRRRALRHYLSSLSYEIYDRGVRHRVEELEGTILVRRPDITEKLMRDVLDRTDLVLQQLHRQIEGVRARQGKEIGELRAEVERLRSMVGELQSRHSVTEPASD